MVPSLRILEIGGATAIASIATLLLFLQLECASPTRMERFRLLLPPIYYSPPRAQ